MIYRHYADRVLQLVTACFTSFYRNGGQPPTPEWGEQRVLNTIGRSTIRDISGLAATISADIILH